MRHMEPGVFDHPLERAEILVVDVVVGDLDVEHLFEVRGDAHQIHRVGGTSTFSHHP